MEKVHLILQLLHPYTFIPTSTVIREMRVPMFSPRSPHVLSLEFSCTEQVNSMDNLLSYCGLVNARISTSEKDLPVKRVNLRTLE